jgi:hypothetical protein
LSITLPAAAFPVGHQIVEPALGVIESKRKKVANYGSDARPLWLVLCLSEEIDPAHWAFGPIRAALNRFVVPPFDRIVIGCLEGGFVIPPDPALPVRHVTLFGESDIPRVEPPMVL